ncbi:unnamed protein product [Notodromas monacha]|uniref:Uncharacterized protein n=1 Tax=Notodromas monacha TaxID=399045 RepID=A0A7R9G878_9CRUS|nr:unnamed protein product [Notodromas monacha]CAG0912848.1 unnamed protein product [Notodromas monacha]
MKTHVPNLIIFYAGLPSVGDTTADLVKIPAHTGIKGILSGFVKNGRCQRRNGETTGEKPSCPSQSLASDDEAAGTPYWRNARRTEVTNEKIAPSQIRTQEPHSFRAPNSRIPEVELDLAAQKEERERRRIPNNDARGRNEVASERNNVAKVCSVVLVSGDPLRRSQRGQRGNSSVAAAALGGIYEKIIIVLWAVGGFGGTLVFLGALYLICRKRRRVTTTKQKKSGDGSANSNSTHHQSSCSDPPSKEDYSLVPAAFDRFKEQKSSPDIILQVGIADPGSFVLGNRITLTPKARLEAGDVKGKLIAKNCECLGVVRERITVTSGKTACCWKSFFLQEAE